MEKWQVQLDGQDEDLKYVSKKFNSPIITIIQDNNAYYLKSDSFKQLKYENEVRLKASELIEKINMILKVDTGSYNIKFGKVNRLDGKKSNVQSSSLKCTTRTIDSQRIDADYMDLIKCIYENEKVEDAFIFYFLDSNWVNLYKVWETIAYDIGCAKMGKEGIYKNIIKCGKYEITKNLKWAKEKEMNLFGCTAHNRKGAGLDARHAVEEGINPYCKEILSSSKPMPIGVAQKLIKRILNNWIITKLIV
jgi:hypothetical protein